MIWSWDTITGILIVTSCTLTGMFIGAWIAAKGFERSLIKMLDDIESITEND